MKNSISKIDLYIKHYYDNWRYFVWEINGICYWKKATKDPSEHNDIYKLWTV